jgi:hypothetical protein
MLKGANCDIEKCSKEKERTGKIVHTDRKEKKIFLIFKMRKYFLIYEEAVSHI